MYISHDICMIFPSQQPHNWIEREKLGVLRCKYHLYHSGRTVRHLVEITLWLSPVTKSLSGLVHLLRRGRVQ